MSYAKGDCSQFKSRRLKVNFQQNLSEYLDGFKKLTNY